MTDRLDDAIAAAEARRTELDRAPSALELPVDVVLDVNPVPLARPRVIHTPGRGVRTFTPARSRAFSDAFRWACRGARLRGAPLDVPLRVELQFWRRCRSSANRGDIDNLAKAVLDAGNRFLWTDDRLVVALTTELVESGPTVDGRIGLRIRGANSA